MVTELPTVQQATPTLKKGSPWSGLGRKLTDDEWEELKKWRKENPDQRNRFGDTRSDGMVFWGYMYGYRNGESWVSAAVFSQRRRDHRILMQRLVGERGYREREAMAKRIKRRNPVWHAKIIAQEKASRLRRRARISMSKREYHARKMATDARYREERRIKNAARMRDGDYAKLAYWALRRKNRSGQLHPDRNDQLIHAVKQAAVDASACNNGKFHVDHIIPLFGGGWHHELNLQVLPKPINQVKNDDPFWLSDEYKDFRDVPEFLWPEALRPHYHFMLRIFGHPLKKYAEAI